MVIIMVKLLIIYLFNICSARLFLKTFWIAQCTVLTTSDFNIILCYEIIDGVHWKKKFKYDLKAYWLEWDKNNQ